MPKPKKAKAVNEKVDKPAHVTRLLQDPAKALSSIRAELLRRELAEAERPEPPDPEWNEPVIIDPRFRPIKAPEPDPANLQELKEQIRRWIVVHATPLRLEPAENPPDASGIFSVFNRYFFELTGYCIQAMDPFDGLTILEGLCEKLWQPITLTEFLVEYCGVTRVEADRQKKNLQNAVSEKTYCISLPGKVGVLGKGRTDRFRAIDLLKKWPEYREAVPKLPMPVKQKVLA